MSHQDAKLPESKAAALIELPLGLPPEARQTQRQEYPFPQRFAYFREDRWPANDEFRWADLCDISARGLALLLTTRPTASMLVVELGVGTNVSQVLAQVVQVVPITVAGEQRFRVGCMFVAPQRRA